MPTIGGVKHKTRKRYRKKDRRSRINDGHPTKAADDLVDEFSRDLEKLSFDPHDLTDKIIKFGKILTGIELYDYQLDPVYRTIFSVITLEGASVTLLTARQCIKKGSIVHTRDGKMVPIEQYPGAELTRKNTKTLKITSYLGHEIECTPDHLVFTPEGWKEARDIHNGDSVACMIAWDKFPVMDGAPIMSSTGSAEDFCKLLSEMTKPTLRKTLNGLWDDTKKSFFSPTSTVAQIIRESLNKLGFPAAIRKIKHINYHDACEVYFKFKSLEQNFEQFLSDPGFKLALPNPDFIGEDGELYKFAPVTVEEGEVCDTYDISVPDKFWFTCGGIKVHNSGKSEALAFVIATLMVLLPAIANLFEELQQFSRGFYCGIFAPQADQVDNAYQRVKSRLGTDQARTVMEDDDIDTGVKTWGRLTLFNGSFCSAQVASKVSKIEGNSLDLVIIDEAQEVDTMVAEKSIEPMTAATGGTILRCGTTGRSKNNFYEEINFNRRSDMKQKDDRLKTHFEYDYRKIIQSKAEQFKIDKNRFHLNYEKKIKRTIARHGKNSESFKLSYALIWTLETGMFMTEDTFHRVGDKRLKLLGVPEEGDTYVFGIDWAKADCSTVITVLKVEPDDTVYDNKEDYEDNKPKKTLVQWYELEGTDYENQHYIIMELISTWRPVYVASDYTGVGVPPTERLMYAVDESTEIVPFTFSRPSKSDMWQELEADIKAGRFKFPAHKSVQELPSFQNFYMQLTNAVRYYVGSFLVVHKGEGFYDDYLDSLGLATIAGNMETELMEEIEVEEENPLFGGTNGTRGLIEDSRW